MHIGPDIFLGLGCPTIYTSRVPNGTATRNLANRGARLAFRTATLE